MAVGAGGKHALALLESGELYAWGDNGYGQLGDGTAKDRPRPQLIKSLSGKIVGLAVGAWHSMVFLESGEICSWGDNTYGQLGDGTTLNRVSPKLIRGIPGKVTGLAAGFFHSVAFTESGEVYGWGRNVEGQLGEGTTTDIITPRLIKGIPSKVTGLAAGSFYSLALTEVGEVYGWGDNNEGQLGDGSFNSHIQPHLSESIPGKAVGLVSGSSHSMVLLESGEIYGWGMNRYGQLGDGTNQRRNYPQLIKDIPQKVVGITAGDYHSLALLESGTVYGWGDNSQGQLGGGQSKPVLFPKSISKMDERFSFSFFGKGGKAVGFDELEKKFRELLSLEFIL